MFFLVFIAGPAENCAERAVGSECARADEHESDHALLQQPHDVLPDQLEVSAGCKPKTHGRRVQPGRSTTVRALKESEPLCASEFVLLTVQLAFFC